MIEIALKLKIRLFLNVSKKLYAVFLRFIHEIIVLILISFLKSLFLYLNFYEFFHVCFFFLIFSHLFGVKAKFPFLQNAPQKSVLQVF